MSNIEVNMKKWIKLIQAEKLAGIMEDIQANIVEELTEKLNTHIFKLLLYLSHAADKCAKEKYIVGKEIYKLSCFLCSLLTEIPNSQKFVASLFHIIRCLLAMCMYKEASNINCYLKLGAVCLTDANVNGILVKIRYLWYNASHNTFLRLEKTPSNSNYQEFENVLKHELDIIQIVYKNYTKQLLMKISSNLDKMTSASEELNGFLTEFNKFIIEYLKNKRISLDEDEKYVIYRHMLHILSKMLCRNINEQNFHSAEKVLDVMCNYFKEILIYDEECYQCFQQFELICFILVKPVERLIENNAKTTQGNMQCYVQTVKKYGYSEAMKWTSLSIVQVLEPLLMYWETCINAGKKMFLMNDTLLETMNLVVPLSTFFIKQVSDKCKSCKDTNCTIKRDIYNAVVIKTRCVSLVSKVSVTDLSRDICTLARKFLEQNIASIYEMKRCKCKCWIHLWCTTGALIYNLGIQFECFYEESTLLFYLLCTAVIQFEGVYSESRYIVLQNPICSTLHRLSTVHYNYGMYREAMTTSALNGLLSYNDLESKAFRMWANIKHKCATSSKILETTMLACLKADKKKMEKLGFTIELSKHDLAKICLREVRGLRDAKVNLSSAIWKVLSELTVLEATPMEYAYAVEMLAFHLLHLEHNEDISECLKQTVDGLRQLKPNGVVLHLEANLEFFIFVNQLRAMSKQTQMEMETTKFALHALRLSEMEENEPRNIVPAYTLINVKEDSKLMMSLQKPLQKWNKSMKKNIKEIIKNSEPIMALRILITAGEYCRLYRYQKCEIDVWKLAYQLATELNDNPNIIYVTGRSISLRYINHKWITVAKELATKLKNTNNEETICAIAILWISLSDFYFEQGMYDEGRKLLDDARSLPEISFISNIAVYLYSLDRILYNCYLYKEDMKHEEYTRYIVETLYTMVNLNEELNMRKWKPQEKYLFGYDVLFSTTVNLSLRMNNLLSFREIGAHLVRRLKSAQILGASIRVAEKLKSLCYIDLSRSQLNDCEVKLQGLENILDIETVQLSMNSNLPKNALETLMITPTRVVDPIRDVPYKDTSPVLKSKVFDLPEFVRHKNCDCYLCQNISYHYLVLASTHIRAQLNALQNHFPAALQHFQGAFQIKEKLVENEYQLKSCIENCTNTQVYWQESYYIVDYVLLLLNFSSFLKSDMKMKQKEAVNIILLAIRMCEMYKLQGHPIYMSAKELLLDDRFQRTINHVDYSTFTVPMSSNIDISKYKQEQKIEHSITSTPIMNNTCAKKPLSLRRNRTPPLFKLTKIPMDFGDEEDSNISPPAPIYKRTRSRSKLTRKILDEELADNNTITKDEIVQSNDKVVTKEVTGVGRKSLEDSTMKEVISKIASLVPDISEHLYKLADPLDGPATNENIMKVINKIENLVLNGNSQKRVRNSKRTPQSSSSEYNTKVSQVVELFKSMIINKKKDTVLDCVEELISSLTIDSNNVQKQCSTTRESNPERLFQHSFPVNICNTEKEKELHIDESTKIRTKRNSTKRNVTSKRSTMCKD